MKRRYKLLVIIFISFILLLIIYYTKPHKPYMYISIGTNLNYKMASYDYISYINNNIKNSNYIHKHIEIDDLSINNVIKLINNNEKNIGYYIHDANLITICLDTFELDNYKVLDQKTKELYLDNIDKLFLLLNRITKSKVYFINGYDYLNKEISFLAYKHKINYLLIPKEHSYIIHSRIYLNNRGAKYLANMIIK